MILSLRRKVSIKVRQPLARIMIPVPDKSFRNKFEAIRELVLSEVNVKEVEYLDDSSSILIKKIRPNFKTLGPRYGKIMKDISAAISEMKQEEITRFESSGSFTIEAGGQKIELQSSDVEIISEDIPGWLVANEGKLTVALDITVTDELRYEGIARELVNRIQNIRKDSGYEVTDKIVIVLEDKDFIREAVNRHSSYISGQTLATSVGLAVKPEGKDIKEIEIDDIAILISVSR